MYTTKKKIQKDKDAEPTEFEETVAQVKSFWFPFKYFGFLA